MMTQAMSSFLSSTSDIAEMSLYSTVRVYCVAPWGTPAEDGVPSVEPDPAFTRTASWAPWNPPFILTIPFLPVNALAVRIACMVASVPEQERRTICADGMEEEIFSSRASSGSEGAP